MLLWDHSVRRLMHTSPPWDVPQASPSAINQAFRSRDAPLNPKIASSTHYKSVLFAQIVSFRSFLLSRLICPLTHTYNSIDQQFGSTQFHSNSHKWFQIVSKSPDRHFKDSEVVTNSSCMFRIQHNSSATCLISIQMPLNSSPDVNACLYIATTFRKCVELIVDRPICSIHNRNSIYPKLFFFKCYDCLSTIP